MFVDFNKIFKNKNQTELAIPKDLIEYMNKSLPEGVKYISSDNGICMVTSTDESFSIGGFTFEPTEEQKRILGKKYSQEDIFEYFYNIQKPLPLKLKKKGYILLNGKEFPIEKIAYNPLVPIRDVTGSLYMFPPKFPEPFDITVESEKYERTLLVSRIPNNSVSVKIFESSKDEPFYIQYSMDEKNNSIIFNVSYDLAKAKNIKDIVESTSIYNAFVDGNGKVLGQAVKIRKNQEDVKRFDVASIQFWEKVLKIEERLEVNFIPPKGNVDADMHYLIEQLYQNLINKVPTKYNKRLNSVEIKGQFDENKKSSMNGSIYFEFESEVNITLLGVQINLIALIGVFNTIVEVQEISSEKQKIIFRDESKEKKQFLSMICFKNENELNEYKKDDHKKIIQLFQEAKNPYEYV